MKKYIFILCALVCAMSMNAQSVRVYQDGKMKFEVLDADSVVFMETPASTPVTEKKGALAKVVFEAVTVDAAMDVMNRQTEEGKMTFAYEEVQHYDIINSTCYVKHYGCGEDSIEITYYVADGQSADSLTSVVYTNTSAGNTLKTIGLANLDSLGAIPMVCGVNRPFDYGTASNVVGQDPIYVTFRTALDGLGGKGSEYFTGYWKDMNNKVRIYLNDTYTPSSNSKSKLRLEFAFPDREYFG